MYQRYQRKNEGSISKFNRFISYGLISLLSYTGCASQNPTTMVPTGSEEPIKTSVAPNKNTGTYLDGLLDTDHVDPLVEKKNWSWRFGKFTQYLTGVALLGGAAYGINEAVNEDNGHDRKRDIVVPPPVVPPPTGGEGNGGLGGGR